MKKIIYSVAIVAMLMGCDKKNDALVYPNLDENFPQIIMIADEGDGELEDEDKFSLVLTLAERADPDRKELGGKIIPLTSDVTVHFEVSEWEGFDGLQDYLLGADAFYEIDDCTTSADQDIDLNLTFDASTGKGSVTFPADVEEIEIEFETNPDKFDDDILNPEVRMLTIKLTDIDQGSEHVVVNTAHEFNYYVLDDEAIYGAYELDITDAEQFSSYIQLFSLVNPEIAQLSADEVEEISVEFKYGEFSAVIVLKETEEIDECGEKETVHKEIEIEGDLDEIDDSSLSGEVAIVGDIELDSGAEEEFIFKGSFTLQQGLLLLTLQGEFGGNEGEEIILKLKK